MNPAQPNPHLAPNDSDKVLNFVAGGEQPGGDITALDGDLYSWMFMNSDLFSVGPSPANGAPVPPSNAHPPTVDKDFAVDLLDDAEGPLHATSSYSLASSVDGDSGGEATTAAMNALNPDDPEDERKLKRLQKNREIARNCRKRKRERMTALENEVVKLKEWNRQLEMKLNQGKEGTDREDLRMQEMKQLKELLGKGAAEADVRQKMEKYAEMYSDFGRERRAAINFHLCKLKSLLLPNQVSKMTMWSLQQDDEFYDEKKNQRTFGGSIWNMLCQATKLSNDQKKKLIQMRGEIRQQRQNLGECLRILGELEGRIGDNFQSLARQMSNMMNVTSPSQQARFLLWIEDNQACMHMLNNLWNQKEGDVPGAPPKRVKEEAPK